MKTRSSQTSESQTRIVISALSRFATPTGICRYAASLASSIAFGAENFTVYFVVGSWQDCYFRSCFDLANSTLRILPISIANRSVSRNYWYLHTLPKVASELRATLVHLSFPVPLIRSEFQCPVVTTIHDLYPYEYPQNFGFPAYLLNRQFLRRAVTQSDALCCVSSHTRDGLSKWMGRIIEKKPIRVIPNAVDLRNVAARFPTCMPNENSSYILSVAQHRANKRLDILITAFSLLRSSGTLSRDVRLVIVGGQGPETARLNALVDQLDLRAVVIFAERISEGELVWLYTHALALVIASCIEGFCIPLIEAMQLGCRIVCSDLAILRELGGDYCAYFSDAADLPRAVATGVADVLRRGQPPANPLDCFSRMRLRSEYVDLYASLGQLPIRRLGSLASPAV
jgi:glycosyltransferase involved in cell wall biosynthesis